MLILCTIILKRIFFDITRELESESPENRIEERIEKFGSMGAFKE